MKFFSLAFLLFLQLSFAGEYTFKGVLTLPNAQTPSGNPIGSIEVAYHLDAYFQEPTEKFVMSYTPVDENTRILGNAKFRARVYTGSHATEAYLHFSPITPAPNKKGWDFPGSPDWEDMFHTMTGGAISEARARELYKTKALRLADLEIVAAKVTSEEESGDSTTPANLQTLAGQMHLHKSGEIRSEPENQIHQAVNNSSVREWSTPYATGLPKSFTVSEPKEKLQDANGKLYRVLKFTLEKLPPLQVSGKPLDYAEVQISVNSASGLKFFEEEMRVGDTWTGMFEAFGGGIKFVYYTISAHRAYEEKEEEDTESEEDPFKLAKEAQQKQLKAAEEKAKRIEAERKRKEFERQLKKAGVKLGSGDVQVTLTWDNYSDVDLYVKDPSGTTISHRNKSSSTRGRLDVDDTNGFGPENIFWPKDRSPSGTYRVQVKLHKGSSANYKVRVIYNDQVYFYEGRLSGKGDIETVTTFTK